MSVKYYDRSGQQIDVNRYHELLAVPAYTAVGLTGVRPAGRERLILVSTIWLGVDFNLGRAYWPAIFETMSYSPVKGDPSIVRYPTEPAALGGHELIVAETMALYPGSVRIDFHPPTAAG